MIPCEDPILFDFINGKYFPDEYSEENYNRIQTMLMSAKFTKLNDRVIKYFSISNHLIFQLDRQPFTYDQNYVNIYDRPEYKEASGKLNFIRCNLIERNTNQLFHNFEKVAEETNKWLSQEKINKLISQNAYEIIPIPRNTIYVIEYGYGNGSFLNAAHSYFVQQNKLPVKLLGYDVADSKIDFPPSFEHSDKVNWGWQKIKNKLGIVPNVFCLFDVLEHMPNPFQFIANLPVGSYVALSLPLLPFSFSCFSRLLSFERQFEIPSENISFIDYKHLKPDEHLYHFTREGIKLLASLTGCKLIYIGHDEDEVRKPWNKLEPNIISAVLLRTKETPSRYLIEEPEDPSDEDREAHEIYQSKSD